MANTDYANQRLNAALVESGGDTAAARRLLATQCAGDERLLRDLVGPFLPGIISHAVSRAAAQNTKAQPKTPAVAGSMLDTVVGHLGRSIGETELPRGMTALTEPASRPKASKRHQDAIKLLATAYRTPR